MRLQIRPSGTEPKVKLYGEGIGIDPCPLPPLALHPPRNPSEGFRPTSDECLRPPRVAANTPSGATRKRGGAELAVAGVAEAGDDERVLVEVFVDGGGVDRQVEAGRL